MKKFLLLFAVMIVAFAFTACEADNNQPVVPPPPPDITVNDPVDEPPPQPAETPEPDDGESEFTINDMPTARIGVQNATTGHIFAEENFPDAHVDAFPLGADAIMALLAGQVDAVIIDGEPARYFVEANAGRLTLLPETLTSEYYGISFQHGSPYTALFDDALNTLRDNGVLYGLIDYWVNEDPTASRYVSPPGMEHPNGTLTMATNAAFPPFEFWEGDQIVGLDPCLAQAIGDILGYEIIIEDMAFDAIILAVQAGQVDFGMAGMTVRDDRREFVDFSQGYFESSQRVIVRAD